MSERTYGGLTADELRALALTATPGPWAYVRDEASRPCITGGDNDKWVAELVGWPGDGTADGENNAAYIAAASPATVLSLLDELAAREYLDDEAQQGADLVNAELKEQRAEIARLRAENARAAALLRACDAFTGRVRVLPDAFAPGYWFAIHTDRQFTSRAPGQTHTDALIALGDLLASPTIGEE